MLKPTNLSLQHKRSLILLEPPQISIPVIYRDFGKQEHHPGELINKSLSQTACVQVPSTAQARQGPHLTPSKMARSETREGCVLSYRVR